MLRYLPNIVTLELDAEKCVGCGRCMEVCPHAVFLVDQRKAQILDRDACMECGACARNCPVAALQVQSGVGCATGLLSAALGIKSECCCSQTQNCRSDEHPK